MLCRLAILLAILASTMISSCGSQVAGGGTETGNGVAVALTRDTLRIAAPAGVAVGVYSSSAIPYDTSAYKDSGTLPPTCSLSLAMPDTAPFNVLLWDHSRSLSLALLDLSLPSDTNTVHISAALEPDAILAGNVSWHQSFYDSASVFIRGTPFSQELGPGSNGLFAFGRVPRAAYTLEALLRDRPCIPPTCTADIPKTAYAVRNVIATPGRLANAGTLSLIPGTKPQ